MSNSEAANDGKLEETLKSYTLNEVNKVEIEVAGRSPDGEHLFQTE